MNLQYPQGNSQFCAYCFNSGLNPHGLKRYSFCDRCLSLFLTPACALRASKIRRNGTEGLLLGPTSESRMQLVRVQGWGLLWCLTIGQPKNLYGGRSLPGGICLEHLRSLTRVKHLGRAAEAAAEAAGRYGKAMAVHHLGLDDSDDGLRPLRALIKPRNLALRRSNFRAFNSHFVAPLRVWLRRLQEPSEGAMLSK